jgi:hypothetical protein
MHYYNLFFPFYLLIAITVITFFVSLLSVYGFRVFSFLFWLVSNGNCIAIQKKQRMKYGSSLLNGVGGLWYLVVSFIFENLLL